MCTTLAALFAVLFDRKALLARARQLKALVRLKLLHPADVLLALVQSSIGDERPSIATARRQFEVITGYMPEESSFYERLNPGLADLGWGTFLGALAKANRVQRREVARALGMRVRDVRAVDASVVTLPARAAAQFPSTDSLLGGFKITAALSILEELLVSVHVTDARQHDRKALGLPQAVRAVLFLMDRGYADHRLFAHIADGHGFFIIRLKTSSQPVIRTIRSGVAKCHLRKRLDGDIPVYGIVDLDADFTVGRNEVRSFRVVGIPVARNRNGEPDWIWLATNLPPHVAAATVGAFYQLRWSVETMFRALKSVGRLDSLPSGNPDVIRVFIAATLIGLVFSQWICAAMRAERSRCEPSLLRVFALLLKNLAQLAAAYRAGQLAPALIPFVAALWREGVNPNPGRHYASTRHLVSVGD
jgi:hypothetical protein